MVSAILRARRHELHPEDQMATLSPPAPARILSRGNSRRSNARSVYLLVPVFLFLATSARAQLTQPFVYTTGGATPLRRLPPIPVAPSASRFRPSSRGRAAKLFRLPTTQRTRHRSSTSSPTHLPRLRSRVRPARCRFPSRRASPPSTPCNSRLAWTTTEPSLSLVPVRHLARAAR
jgi:hypothetical protein